jgi:hypothetical protein
MKLAPVASPVRKVSYWCPDPGNAETALSGLPGAGTGRSRRNGGLAPPWHVRHVPPDLTPRTPGASTPAWIRLPRPKRAPCAGADALPRRGGSSGRPHEQRADARGIRD